MESDTKPILTKDDFIKTIKYRDDSDEDYGVNPSKDALPQDDFNPPCGHARPHHCFEEGCSEYD